MAEHRGPVAWLRSVRVRLTLAAVLATALAVTSAGWLLVRSVEDTQTARVRDSAEDLLDDVATSLETGAPPEVAIERAMADVASAADAAGSPTFVQVVAGDGQTMAAGPLLPTASGDVMALRIDGSAAGEDAVVLGPPAPGTGGVDAPGPSTDARAGSDAGAPPTTDARPDASSGGPADDTRSDAPADGPTIDGEPGAEGEGQAAPNDPDRADAVSDQVTLVAARTVLSFEPEQISRTVQTPTGEVTVFAAAPVDEVQENLDAVRRGLWIGVPLLVVAVAVVAWHLVGRALRPVEAIRSEVAAIGGTTMHRRVPTPDNDDEIGRLAHTMNGMLDRLEAAATRQRRFVSDASHELRSPVAAIRTDVEVALREGDAADWAAVGAAVLAEEARLERLLDDLLTLAAADEHGATPPVGEHVAVDDLMADVVARPRRVPVRHAGRADPDASDPDASDHTRDDGTDDGDVRGGPSDVLSVAGRPDQLARLLTNLVDNAARHATSAVEVGAVATSSPAGDPAVHLFVDDDGPGIPAADRVRVFERFARLDDGRTRDRGGTGLGLAVVRSIALAHRGRVWIEDSALGGARFVVELPLAPVRHGRDDGEAGTGTGNGRSVGRAPAAGADIVPTEVGREGADR